ncbi:hypothetical protein HKX48_004253 [Thoreauomyces humboldtii]|nr:hypothetical protein HKX48_004253 [Thoreauomyces humboldtii]
MRPDPHKAKATKRWKSKNAVPSTAQGVPLAGERPAPPPPQQPGPESSEDDEVQEKPRSKFARRKLESNAYRFHEPTAEEVLAADADIDRETEALRMLINEAGVFGTSKTLCKMRGN